MVEQVVIIDGEEISVRAKSKVGLKCKEAAVKVWMPVIGAGHKLIGFKEELKNSTTKDRPSRKK